MKKILPKTKLGKWSVGLIIGFFLLLALMMILVASGQRGGETFFDNPILAIVGILAGFSAIISFLCGTISIIMKKEQSILIFITMLIGFLVLIFVFGEISSPH